MKNKFPFLIAMAGWVDRFREGMINNFQFLSDNAVIQFFFTEKYQERTLENREAVIQESKNYGMNIDNFSISEEGDPDAFLTLKSKIEGLCISANDFVLVDISTMNRENIWYVLFILNHIGANTHYVYYPSLKHGDGELTKDPSKPRFLFKMSGEPKLGRNTAIVALTGFDPERTTHFVHHFDPSKIRLGVQTGKQLNNHIRNIEKHEDKLIADCENFEINSYDLASCTTTLIQEVAAFYDDHNLIVTSLGPKIGSIACFEMWCRMRSTALAYIPVNVVSETYSQGTDIKKMVGPAMVNCSQSVPIDTLTKVEFKNHTTKQAIDKTLKEFTLPLPDHIELDDYEFFPTLYFNANHWDEELRERLDLLLLSICTERVIT
jgi:hypothetical protein